AGLDGANTLALIVAIIVVPSLGGDDDSSDEPATVPTPPTQTNGATTTTPVAKRKPQRPAAKRITVRDGKPVGGVKRLSYKTGRTVNVVVTSNTADEIHVHGYDIEKPLPAGRPVGLRFRANIEGIFEIELHGSGEQIAELRVRP
ncbi:MAG: hypothetical protein ACRDKY_11875, partial [Solirubrobacteraceae bacterium]